MKLELIRHIMLDLETLGTGSNAPILSIGAVGFTEKGFTGDEFYQRLDLQESLELGFTPDASTFFWWLEQQAAANELLSMPEESVKDTLKNFNHFLHKLYVPDEIRIWGNGARFDNAKLANAYERLGMRVPWSHLHDRCHRTVKSMNRHVSKPTFEGVQHNPLHDARNQVIHLLRIQNAAGVTLS